VFSPRLVGLAFGWQCGGGIPDRAHDDTCILV